MRERFHVIQIQPGEPINIPQNRPEFLAVPLDIALGHRQAAQAGDLPDIVWSEIGHKRSLEPWRIGVAGRITIGADRAVSSASMAATGHGRGLLAAWLGRPSACFALVALCIAQAWMAEPDTLAGRARGWLFPIRAMPQQRTPAPIDAAATLEGGETRLEVPGREDSIGDWLTSRMATGVPLYVMTARASSSRFGGWQHVLEIERFEVTGLAVQGSDAWDGEAVAAARAMLAERLAGTEEYREVADELAAGDVGRVRVLWLGLLNDLIAAALLVAAAVSARLTVGTLRAWRHRVRRSAQSECAGCGYDLRGFEGRTCPECGAEARPPSGVT